MYLKHKLVSLCSRSQVFRHSVSWDVSVSSCNPCRVHSRGSCCSWGSKDLGRVFGISQTPHRELKENQGPPVWAVTSYCHCNPPAQLSLLSSEKKLTKPRYCNALTSNWWLMLHLKASYLEESNYLWSL